MIVDPPSEREGAEPGADAGEAAGSTASGPPSGQEPAATPEAQAAQGLSVDLDRLLRNVEDPDTIALLDLINIC